mmetsp:Transcript_6407/g.9310  ORF Transcript_6407/g.9310 Transcript_6407/m.9310 type:complete len:260 (-) Transcript_6407:415-1194(-)
MSGPPEIQLEHLRKKAEVEKEKKNESTYREKYFSLLTTFRRSLKPYETDADKNYEKESFIMKKALSIEREALVGGAFTGVAAFLTMRYLPHVALRISGNKKALQKIEKVAKQSSTMDMFRKGAALVFEGSFGIWAGWRGYNMTASLQSADLYDEVSKIPLCEGKSSISENLCPGWTELTYKKIPQSFWESIDDPEDDFADKKFWAATRSFAENCLKRDLYAKEIRQNQNILSEEPVAVPAPGVPENIDITQVVVAIKNS